MSFLDPAALHYQVSTRLFNNDQISVITGELMKTFCFKGHEGKGTHRDDFTNGSKTILITGDIKSP